MIKNLTILLGAFAASAITASAQITINATDTGWYRADGDHDPSNNNYFTGTLFGDEHRSFFHFDLSALSGFVLSAELRIFNPQDSFYSADASETLNIFDVSTSSATLLGGTGDVAAFGDLGSGSNLGSAVLTPASNGTFTNINLNGTALALLEAALGGNISFGGALSSIIGGADQAVFALSDSDFVAGNVQLALRLENDGQFSPIPEPSTYGLIGAAGLIGLVLVRRRRNAAK